MKSAGVRSGSICEGLELAAYPLPNCTILLGAFNGPLTLFPTALFWWTAELLPNR